MKHIYLLVLLSLGFGSANAQEIHLLPDTVTLTLHLDEFYLCHQVCPAPLIVTASALLYVIRNNVVYCIDLSKGPEPKSTYTAQQKKYLEDVQKDLDQLRKLVKQADSTYNANHQPRYRH